jgi:hypothetical protein
MTRSKTIPFFLSDLRTMQRHVRSIVRHAQRMNDERLNKATMRLDEMVERLEEKFRYGDDSERNDIRRYFDKPRIAYKPRITHTKH